MENASPGMLQSCCLLGTRHLFLCGLCREKLMAVLCRCSSLLFTFG